MHLLALIAALLIPASASANQLFLGLGVGGAVSECATAPCYNGTPFISFYDFVTDNNSTEDIQTCGTGCDLTLNNSAAINNEKMKEKGGG